MTAFSFTETVPAETAITTKLGATTSDKAKSTTDIGKAVKLSTTVANCHVLCAINDEIRGFLRNVEATTIDSGFSWGSIVEEGWQRVITGVHHTGTASGTGATATFIALAPGDLVVADTQAVFGTADSANQWAQASGLYGTGVPTHTTQPGEIASTNSIPAGRVKIGTPTTHRWEVMSLLGGTGLAGTEILIRRI
jgi:hypothetical protein